MGVPAWVRQPVARDFGPYGRSTICTNNWAITGRPSG